MTNYINRTGLYRVWVPLHDDGKAPLISIWIDPRMSAFESRTDEQPAANSGAGEEKIAEEIEDPLSRGPQTALHAVR